MSNRRQAIGDNAAGMKNDHIHRKSDEAKAQPELKGFTVSEQRGRFVLFARVDTLGPDLLVTLWGGTAHIGALGMAVPRASLRDPAERSATSSVFTFPGHKEDVTVKLVSEALSGRLNRNVVVVAGIHWDGLQPDDIRQLMEAFEALQDRIALEVEKSSAGRAPAAPHK